MAKHLAIVGYIVLAAGLLRSLQGQTPAPPDGKLLVNRFQLIDRRVEGSQLFILVDNATGHCWERALMTSQTPPRWEWRDIGCPPAGFYPEIRFPAAAR